MVSNISQRTGSVEHQNCPYSAAVFHIEGCGDFWFCNKCGQGDEVFDAATLSRRRNAATSRQSGSSRAEWEW